MFGGFVDHLPENPKGDLALAEAAGRGDPRARRILADLLLNRVRTMVSYIVGTDQDADDLVQASLVEILMSAGSYRGEGQLSSWADRITVRTAMRMLRKRSAMKEVPAPDGDAAETVEPSGPYDCPVLPQPAESQEQAVARYQLRRRLAVHLGKLTPERRVAVALRWVHGYSLNEIAEFTDSSVNTVRDRLQVGKRQLQKAIATDPVLRDYKPGAHS